MESGRFAAASLCFLSGSLFVLIDYLFREWLSLLNQASKPVLVRLVTPVNVLALDTFDQSSLLEPSNHTLRGTGPDFHPSGYQTF